MIASAFPGALDYARFLQFADQPKSGSLSDADSISHIAKSRIRVVGETNQDVGVIAKERPVMNSLCHRSGARGFIVGAEIYDRIDRKTITR
jgi:hypothetical protein